MPWVNDSFVRDPGDGGDTDRVWRRQRDAGEPINADYMDAHDQDMADGITECLHREGQNKASKVVFGSGGDHQAANSVELKADENIDGSRVVKLPNSDGTLVVSGGRFDHMDFGSDDSIEATHRVRLQASTIDEDKKLHLPNIPEEEGTLFATGYVQDDVRIKQSVENSDHPSYVRITGDDDDNRINGEMTPSKTLRIPNDADDGSYLQVEGRPVDSIVFKPSTTGVETPLANWPNIRLEIGRGNTGNVASVSSQGQAFDGVEEITMYLPIPGYRRGQTREYTLVTTEDLLRGLQFTRFNENPGPQHNAPPVYYVTFGTVDLTANHTINLPNRTGTLATTDQIPPSYRPTVGEMVWRYVRDHDDTDENFSDVLSNGWYRCDSSTLRNRVAAAARVPFDVDVLGLSKGEDLPNPPAPVSTGVDDFGGYWIIYLGGLPDEEEED